MRKALLFLGAALSFSTAYAASTSTYTVIYNPYGGHNQYISSPSSTTITGGTNITVTTTSTGVKISASTGTAAAGITVYPATATASFPFGGSASTFTVTSTFTANIISANVINSTNSWLNVKYYGAKGDGVTNDVPAFQAALAAVGVGGTVFVPNATYYLDNFWIIPGSTTLQCDGNGATILKHGINVPLVGANFIYLGGNGVHIPYGRMNDCTIDGNWPNTVGFTGFELTMGWKSYAKNIEIKNFAMRGIDGSSYGEDATIENPYIVGIGTANAYPAQGDGILALTAVAPSLNKGLRIINPTISNLRNSAIFCNSVGAQTIGGHIFHNHCQTTPTGGGQVAVGNMTMLGTVIEDGCDSVTSGIEENGGSLFVGVKVTSQPLYGVIFQNGSNSKSVGSFYWNNGVNAQVVPGVSSFSFVGDSMYNDGTGLASSYGLNIANGASDNYMISGVHLYGNAINMYDGGTGTNKRILTLGYIDNSIYFSSYQFAGATGITATGSFQELLSIVVPAGDYRLDSDTSFLVNGSSTTAFAIAISSFSGTSGTLLIPGDNQINDSRPSTYDPGSSFNMYVSTHMVFNTTSRVFLKGRSTFSAGTPVFSRGKIAATLQQR